MTKKWVKADLDHEIYCDEHEVFAQVMWVDGNWGWIAVWPKCRPDGLYKDMESAKRAAEEGVAS